ncbi:hypothetical protein NPIL_627651 [Nephila pilipes]|uniref:Uncharacterized protein n=1 Tax=Nephila pilipes TaxID=299642 RepID=A0A8X6QH67_NEPPI|nr:hypothetical protein NPIL_627651 [Nephila pilipes]
MPSPDGQSDIITLRGEQEEFYEVSKRLKGRIDNERKKVADEEVKNSAMFRIFCCFVSLYICTVVWRTSRIQDSRVLRCSIDVPGPLAPPADACGSKQASSYGRRRQENDPSSEEILSLVLGRIVVTLMANF